MANIYNVVKLKREKRLGQLDRLICDTYAEDNFLLMREAVQAWGVLPEYEERRRIFRAGLDAYMRGDYISAVSVWLLQVEGVSLARVKRDGISMKKWKSTIETLAQETDLGDFSRSFSTLYGSATEKPPKEDLPIRRNLILHELISPLGSALMPCASS